MATIEGLTEEDYKTAVAAFVDLVRSKYPNLDLRVGTALRSLVIEPSAFIDASQRELVTRLRTAMSLEAMSRENYVPRDDAEAVLSNFGITLGGGAKASGSVRVNVTSSADKTVRVGAVFTTDDGTEFTSTATVTASVNPASGEEQLVAASDGKYYFTVPVVAKEAGASGNILQGCALSCSTLIVEYYSAEAFSDFSGGEDGETVASAVARIPSAIAYRGMTNAFSARAQLSASMGDPSALHAVSCVGYMDRAQLRDKHNPFGISTGGRVDVYARLFETPGVVSFLAEGVLVDTKTDVTSSGTPANTVGVYRIEIPEYPGFYAVKCVAPADDADTKGSLQYELVRGTVDGATGSHDFLVSDDSHEETAWSSYQSGHILAYDSADGEDHVSSLAVTDREAKKQFKVELYWTDGISELQRIVDSPDVRNVAADYVVRSPAVCLVGVTANVRVRSGVSTSGSELSETVSAYINGRSFVSRLTRSEIANVLIQHGVESIDLSESGMQLYGRVCGADGKWYYLDGDELDVTSVGGERTMLTSGTIVFAAEPDAVQIQIVA